MIIGILHEEPERFRMEQRRALPDVFKNRLPLRVEFFSGLLVRVLGGVIKQVLHRSGVKLT